MKRKFMNSGMDVGSAATKLSAPVMVGRKLSVDPKASLIEWQGSKVIGGSHHGTIKVLKGDVELHDRHLVGGNIVVDMNSIIDLDLTSAD